MTKPNVLPFPGKMPLFAPEDVNVPRKRLQQDFQALQLALGILRHDMAKVEELCRHLEKQEGGIPYFLDWLAEAADHLRAGADLMETAGFRVLAMAKRSGLSLE
jgi:hypothetical protein